MRYLRTFQPPALEPLPRPQTPEAKAFEPENRRQRRAITSMFRRYQGRLRQLIALKQNRKLERTVAAVLGPHETHARAEAIRQGLRMLARIP